MSLFRRRDRAIHGTYHDEFDALQDAIQAAFDAVTPGRVFFVNKNTGSDANDGETWDKAKATIAAAMAVCVSGRGDRIYVAGGAAYGENLVITKDALQIIGAELGGYQRPDIGVAGGHALFVRAQGFVAAHLRLAAVGAFQALRQQGNGFLYNDCVFDGAAADAVRMHPDKDDDSYTASEGKLLDSLIRGGTNGIRFVNPGPGVEGGIGPTDVEVRGCRLYGQAASAITDEDNAGSNGSSFENCVVDDCDFLEPGGGAYAYVSMGAPNSKGVISRARFNETLLVAAQVMAPVGVKLVGAFDATGVVDASAF